MTALRKDEEIILSPNFLEEIKRTRQERGISVEEVAEKTNIKTSYIKAIEDGDLARLPGGIYNRAYIKSVSEFLGISMKPYERKVESDEMIKEKQVRVEIGKPLNASMPSKVTIVGCLFVIFLFYSVFYGPRVTKKEQVENAVATYQEKQEDKAEVMMEKAATPQEKEMIQSELQAKLADTSALIAQIPQVSPIQKETQSYVNNELVITILALTPSKVQVKDSYGVVILNKDMSENEAIMLNGSEEYSLETASIKNLEIYLDGVQVRDMTKIEKRGQSYVFKAEKMVGVAESQPFEKTVAKPVPAPVAATAPATAETQTTETTQAQPAAVPAAANTNQVNQGADQTQNNPQGSGR